MLKCDACNKVYSTSYNLKKHLTRQPLCEKWITLQPGLKDFIDYKISLQSQNNDENKEENTTCLTCNIKFSNVGNLNRHLSTSVICSKWDLYNDLKPINGFIGKLYSEFDAPKYSLNHIIWNVFLIDKEYAKKPEMKEILKENNAKYIIAILPKNDSDSINTCLMDLQTDTTVMYYDGHDTYIDKNLFDVECKKIEEYRSRRENVFVFCNNGYQRSLPFLTYYLTKHHSDEVPNIERAIDIILPQVDKKEFEYNRDNYIEEMKRLLN